MRFHQIITIGSMVIAALIVGLAFASANPDRWHAEGWKTDFTKTTVDLGEVVSGGPPRDGIPSIDNPMFTTATEAHQYADTEPVIRLVIGEDARAYPLSVMTWHEIVNDTVGGRPVAVTYCPLCNAAITFDRQVGDQVLEFGTTGKLRKSDLVMYDRTTDSWWQQFTGESIAGAFAGTELDMIPVRLESFERFRADFPDGKVLIPNNPELRAYGRTPYVGYDSSSWPFLYRGAMPEGVPAMAYVVVPRDLGEPVAVPLAHLRDQGTVEISGVTLAWEPGKASALDTGDIQSGRDIGNVIATRRTDGITTDVVYDLTFAFVFHAFHPEGQFVGEF